MTSIEDIIRIAVAAHEGQKDMVGNPAILHVLSVGLLGKNDLRAKGVEENVLEAVDLLTHKDNISYEDYVKKIVQSGNETAIRVKLNDLHHNLWRAEDALNTLDTSNQERKALLDEIMRIAAVHDRAERFIQNSIVHRT